VGPCSFDPSLHFYPQVQNTKAHSIVQDFFALKKDELIARHPDYRLALDYTPKHFFWGGADLFHVGNELGHEQMLLIETNSCPSGQKSMPALHSHDSMRGYRTLIEQSFLPLVKKHCKISGALAILYDKNEMETRALAVVLAQLTDEEVLLIPCHDQTAEREFCWQNDTLIAKLDQTQIPIRAAIRYVTQKPWNRLPFQSKTFIYNGVDACLSGGRNKLLASYAYEQLNLELTGRDHKIRYPRTIRHIQKREIPACIETMGGRAVIKVPYSNAGQGVFTITSELELQNFMQQSFHYQHFIVQELVGHKSWSHSTFHHLATLPDSNGESFAYDLRLMLAATSEGFRPMALYARRANIPLNQENPKDSWAMLGTNLSVKDNEGGWELETERLLPVDEVGFERLGLNLDKLIEAYIQTALAMQAIDKLVIDLNSETLEGKRERFSNLNSDPIFISEISAL
jgi:hypothetical protein